MTFCFISVLCGAILTLLILTIFIKYCFIRANVVTSVGLSVSSIIIRIHNNIEIPLDEWKYLVTKQKEDIYIKYVSNSSNDYYYKIVVTPINFKVFSINTFTIVDVTEFYKSNKELQHLLEISTRSLEAIAKEKSIKNTIMQARLHKDTDSSKGVTHGSRSEKSSRL